MVCPLILAQSPYPSGSYVEFTERLAPIGTLAARRDLAASLHEYSTALMAAPKETFPPNRPQLGVDGHDQPPLGQGRRHG